MTYAAPSLRAGSAGLSSIFAALAAVSMRPRYAFLVLQLVAEIANPEGRAGPIVASAEGPVGLRDWLTTQLMPMSERNARRAGLRERIIAGLSDRLTGDAAHDGPLIDAAVEGQALTVGRANVSRAISDLVKAGLLRRHYAGYATDHLHRGGGRLAVYVLEPRALAALGPRRAPPPRGEHPRQGDLFAA